MSSNSRLEKYLLGIFYFVIVIRNAWISDDAYITFRTIENFLAGYGLTYNPFVRVQAYTHPAWLFLLSGLYRFEMVFIPRSPDALYYITILISIAISALTLYLIITRLTNENLLISGLVVAAFTFSRAFIDYSTSGLENPLTHLLLVIFICLFLLRPVSLFWMAFVSSLLILTRQDAILLILPAFLYLYFMGGDYLYKLKVFLLGFLPFLAWELFSIFYYGFPFPNTAYAKLNTGIPTVELIQQGGNYLLNSIHWDPLTLLVIICAGLVIYFGSAGDEGTKLKFLYAGVVLYILYIVRIGGDFMSGRFLTAPLLVSVILLARCRLPQRTYLVLTAVVSILGVFSLRSTLLDPQVPILYSPSVYWTDNSSVLDRNGVEDERSVYFANYRDDVHQGLVIAGFRTVNVGSAFAGRNWSYSGTKKVVVEQSIGSFGYTKGPNFYILDNYALADPLLARLPMNHKKWRIGHFYRDVPHGYLETLQTGLNQIEDANLALYYTELNDVIQGPLWSWERMGKIWKFNTGQYNYLLQFYWNGQVGT